MENSSIEILSINKINVANAIKKYLIVFNYSGIVAFPKANITRTTSYIVHCYLEGDDTLEKKAIDIIEHEVKFNFINCKKL